MFLVNIGLLDLLPLLSAWGQSELSTDLMFQTSGCVGGVLQVSDVLLDHLNALKLLASNCYLLHDIILHEKL
jgi:hypothetical protein